jgi:hypothetical protein
MTKFVQNQILLHLLACMGWNFSAQEVPMCAVRMWAAKLMMCNKQQQFQCFVGLKLFIIIFGELYFDTSKDLVLAHQNNSTTC